MRNNTSVEEICLHLRMLSISYRDWENDYPRATTFQNAAEVLLDSGLTVINDASEITGMSGIGPSTLKEVSEFLATTTSKRLESLLKNNSGLSDQLKAMVLDGFAHLESMVQVWTRK